MADLPPEFVNYLKGWPAARAAIFNKELRRIYAMPEVHDRLDEMGVPGDKRHAVVEAQAAQNAQALATQELQKMREHYGVDVLTPDTLLAALAKHDMQFSPRDKDAEIAAQYGRNAHADYAKQSKLDVANKLKEMSTYVPFDQPQAHGIVDMPAEEMIATQPGTAAKPATAENQAGKFILDAAKQGEQQAAGQPVTNPVLPQASAPVASAEVPNAAENR